jgi:hypothetical protein
MLQRPRTYSEPQDGHVRAEESYIHSIPTRSYYPHITACGFTSTTLLYCPYQQTHSIATTILAIFAA